MPRRLALIPGILLGALLSTPPASADDGKRTQELDQFWAEVSRTVKEGDFEGYEATCHEEGVLVSGAKKECYPLSRALARWKKGFEDTKAGKMKASVTFRFSCTAAAA